MRREIRNGVTYLLHDPIKDVPFYNDWLRKLLERSCAIEYTEPRRDRDTGLIVKGEFVKVIKPYDRHMEQATVVREDGAVGVVCINCGKPFFDVIQSVCRNPGEHVLRTKKSRKLMRGIPSARVHDRIRIGGLIQMPVEESVTTTEIEVKYRMQPVLRSGIGCPACQAKYQEIVAQTEPENELKEELNLIRAKRFLAKQEAPQVTLSETRIRCKHGLPRVEFCSVCSKLPKAPKLILKDKPRQPFIDVFDRDIAPPVME